jgi:hypothetical protein
MYKKIVVSLLLVVMVFAPVSNVYAKPQRTVLIEDLVYTVKDVPVPDHISSRMRGRLIYAEGEGTINCNGVTACEQAGLDGQTVVFRQGFTVEIQGVSAGYFKAATAGRLQLPGEYPPVFFKGKGDGTAECFEGTCDLTMGLTARMKGGGKLIFSLIARLDIDFTSAGIVLDPDSVELEGSCVWTR